MDVINARYMDLIDHKELFIHANPFPYVILDNFLEEDFFKNMKNIFKDLKNVSIGKTFNTVVEEKKWISLNSALPSAISQIVDALNSDLWVNNMRHLTGIRSLIATPNGNTKLANYHVMEPGGILGPHVDHSHEPEKGIPHVLNIILYLTEDWNENFGGSTFFYDTKGKKVVSKVECQQNRAVIFLHTPYSFHGVERIKSDISLKRKTLYVDYYSESYNPYEHLNLEFDSHWFKHGTTFKLDHFYDYLKFKNSHYAKSIVRYHLNKWIKKATPCQLGAR